MLVLPDNGKVLGDCSNAGASVVTKQAPVGLALSIVFLLQSVQLPKTYVPVCLKRIGDHTIRGVNVQVPSAGKFGVVTRPLHLLDAHCVSLFNTCGNLVLDSQGHFNGHRRDSFEQQRADGRVDGVPPY